MATDPPNADANDLTGLLNRGMAGDSGANGQAFDIVYDELRRSARRQMRRGGEPATFTPTSLVNEVFLKLSDGAPRAVNDRAHFYSLAARAMRQVLLDHQRGKHAIKRGSGIAALELTAEAFGTDGDGIDYFALDQALESLRAIDPRAATVVEWHFFSGLNFGEIAELLDISDKTARRDWSSARAFLLSQLETG